LYLAGVGVRIVSCAKSVFRFLMLGVFLILCGLKLYGFGGGCVISVVYGMLRAFLSLVCCWGLLAFG